MVRLHLDRPWAGPQRLHRRQTSILDIPRRSLLESPRDLKSCVDDLIQNISMLFTTNEIEPRDSCNLLTYDSVRTGSSEREVALGLLYDVGDLVTTIRQDLLQKVTRALPTEMPANSSHNPIIIDLDSDTSEPDKSVSEYEPSRRKNPAPDDQAQARWKHASPSAVQNRMLTVEVSRSEHNPRPISHSTASTPNKTLDEAVAKRDVEREKARGIEANRKEQTKLDEAMMMAMANSTPRQCQNSSSSKGYQEENRMSGARKEAPVYETRPKKRKKMLEDSGSE